MNAIIAELKKAGHRITRVRTGIVEILTESREPLSVDEVRIALAKYGIRANRTTLHRELSFLTEQHLTQKVNLGDGSRRYEDASRAHHHHLVCTKCGSVADVNTRHNLQTIEKRIAKQFGWNNIEHALEFFGTCPTCSKEL